MNRRQFLLTGVAALTAPAVSALTPPKKKGARLSREEAAKRAQKQLGGGKVLGIKLRNSNSEAPYFDVKLLDGGKVRVLRIDAQ